MPGRRPKPTALRLIEGDRESRINRNEPQPRPVLPECPPDVSDAVRAIWDYTITELDQMGIAYACDRDSLRVYCEAVISHRRACAILKESSVLVKGVHGNMVRNPALQIQRDAAHTIKQFAQEFGLTPSARSRIENHEPTSDASDNPFSGTG